MALGLLSVSCKKDDDNNNGGCNGTTAKVTVHNDRTVGYTVSKIVEYVPGAPDDSGNDRRIAEDVKLKAGEKREFTLRSDRGYVFSVRSDAPDREQGTYANDITIKLKACSDVVFTVQGSDVEEW